MPTAPHPEHIVNLTQDKATLDHKNWFVFDLPDEERAKLVTLLTFAEIPTRCEIRDRASQISIMAAYARQARFKGILYADWPPFGAMVGGSGPLVESLRSMLQGNGIRPLRSFTKQRIIEAPDGQGGISRTSIFRHAGWWPEQD